MSQGVVLVAVGAGDMLGGLMGFAPPGNVVEGVSFFGVAVAGLWICWLARGVA